MGSFFHSWRRKAGCVSLVMALVFTIGWVRGLIYVDVLTLPGNTSALEVATGFFGFGVRYSVEVAAQQPLNWQTIPRPTPSAVQEGEQYNANAFGPDGYWKWEFCGLGMSKIQGLRLVWISYWLCITPLTLLSAYLILWPGKRKAPSPHLPVSTAHLGGSASTQFEV